MERSDVVEEREETVREEGQEGQEGDVEREDVEREQVERQEVEREEDSRSVVEETCERQESEDEDSDCRRIGRSGAKRARNAATFTDDEEMQIVDFVKDHPQLYAKEHMHYVDKARKDALWREVGQLVGRSGDDCRRWFTTQRTRYGKLTAEASKSGSGKKYQLTERTKWVLREFKFMGPHIMRKASTETAGFPSMLSATSPPGDDSRCSGNATDVESMDTSSQPTSQQPSFSAVSTSTPAQPAFTEMFRQTQVLLSEFLKHRQSQEQSARRPFYDFVMSETASFPDSVHRQFQAEVFQLIQKYHQRLQSQPGQATPVKQPSRQPLPTRSATVTSESQKEGVLPPVSVSRVTTQVNTTTASSSTLSNAPSPFCVPSPISFGNPPSVPNWLGGDELNMSQYLLTPDCTAQTTQVNVQPQQLQQITLQPQASTSQSTQYTLVQQPQPLQQQQYTVVQQQPIQQQQPSSRSTTPSTEQPAPPPQ